MVGLDRSAGSGRARRVLGDAQSLPIRDGSVDVVCAVQLLQYLPDKVACLAEINRVLTPGGIAVFAMTEHFGDASAFVPPLTQLTRSWTPAGVVRMVTERRLGSRRVLTFAMMKGAHELSGIQRLERVQQRSDQTDDPLPYLQSVYRHAAPPKGISVCTECPPLGGPDHGPAQAGHDVPFCRAASQRDFCLYVVSAFRRT